MGSLDDTGELTLAGRIGDVVNLDGEKVNLADYDRVANGFIGIDEAAAFLIEDEFGLQQLGIAVVGSQADLRALDRQLIATFGARKPSIVFRTAALPKNQNGKINRDGVAQLYTASRASRGL
jgi:acyl-coenzyme A synthetase/AMP-(fatty) acid ligase